MQNNENEITGVLHYKTGQRNYQLRRYFPEASFAGLIEQFWFVDWDLKEGQTHIQQNLPDPNFHLVFDNGEAKLIGPVRKVYSYKMKGKGRILGVKFMLGALVNLLELPMSEYVDKEFVAQDVFATVNTDLLALLNHLACDQKIVEILQTHMAPFAINSSHQQVESRELVSLIKNKPDISKVEHLSAHSNLSVRAIQRRFHQYLGLSPKWLIRKYRLHQAMEALEAKEANIFDIVEWLGYTDQSHLIRDFRDILGLTPGSYSAPHKE